MEELRDLFRNLGNSLDLEEVLATLDGELRRLIHYDAISVHLGEGRGFTLAYAAGGDLAWLQSSVGEEALAESTRAGQPQVHHRNGAESVVIFPVEQIAVVTLHSETAFTTSDLEVLSGLAPKLASAIGNARKYRQAEQLIEADPQTGLANTRSLFRRLDAEIARARRSANSLAVLQCAIEGFDRSGRLCPVKSADSAFERIARELKENCREYDFAARCGDELVLVLPEFPRKYLDEKRQSVRQVVEEVGLSAGLPLFAAIGEAFFPDEAKDAEDLLAIAARRLLQARRTLLQRVPDAH